MAEGATAEATSGKRGPGLLVWILIGFVGLVAGGGGMFFFLSRGKSAPKPRAAHASQSARHGAASQHEGGEEHEAASRQEGGEEEHAQPGVIALEPFVTNLADPDGDRYVKCTVRLELDAAENAERVKTSELHLTRVRDRVLAILGGKRLEEVSSQEGREQMKEEIRTQLDPLLAGGHVERVYYTEFLVQ